jgi:hypothetical protein
MVHLGTRNSCEKIRLVLADKTPRVPRDETSGTPIAIEFVGMPHGFVNCGGGSYQPQSSTGSGMPYGMMDSQVDCRHH